MSTRKKAAGPHRRTRRSAEASRDHILGVAERRLAAHGLNGLNIADIAREAEISHGTLLHHFGSSDGMRRALVARMAESLLDEVLSLEAAAEPDLDRMSSFFERLFAHLSSGGHARLIAWLMLARDGKASEARPMAATAERFDHLVDIIARRLEGAGQPETDRKARYIVLLVISSAVGLGVARDTLLPQLALNQGDEARYARWLARVIGEHLVGQITRS